MARNNRKNNKHTPVAEEVPSADVDIKTKDFFGKLPTAAQEEILTEVEGIIANAPEAPLPEVTTEDMVIEAQPVTLNGILTNGSPLKERLVAIDSEGSLNHCMAGDLLSLMAFVDGDFGMDEKETVVGLVRFARRLNTVVNIESYDKFHEAFNVVNLAFKEFGGSELDKRKLFSYDWCWTGDSKSLTTFHNLLTVIYGLCDTETRAARTKLYEFGKLFNSKDSNLNESALVNIKKYYN